MYTDMHNLPWPRAGRPSGRPIQRACSLDLAPIDRTIDRPESSLSGSSLDRPGGRPIGKLLWSGRPTDRPTTPTVRNVTVGRSIERSTGKSVLTWPGPQRLYFGSPINIGSFRQFSIRFFRAIFLTFLSIFNKFSKKNLCQNSLSLFVFKVLENQRKSIFWELYFVLHFIYQSRSFPKYFLYCFIFKYFIFSHNWAIISNPIFRIFILWENCLWSFEIRKRVFVIFVITKCISFFALYHLLCRDLY